MTARESLPPGPTLPTLPTLPTRSAETSDPTIRRRPPRRPAASRDDRRALGAEGEERAARFLAGRGYRIVARNIRAGGVEIDVIARRGRLVVFVEVKTRRSQRQGPPELAVDRSKQARIARAASAWLAAQDARYARVRFDVITCLAPNASSGEWGIDHLPGAFDAGGS